MRVLFYPQHISAEGKTVVKTRRSSSPTTTTAAVQGTPSAPGTPGPPTGIRRNMEAIKMSTYPSGKRPPPKEIAKIERDDWPAPPSPAAILPEICMFTFSVIPVPHDKIILYTCPNWKHFQMTIITLSQTSPCFYECAVWVFWKHCGKRINCSQQAISLFPTVFSTRLENFMLFLSNLKLSAANSLSLEKSKICRLGKG